MSDTPTDDRYWHLRHHLKAAKDEAARLAAWTVAEGLFDLLEELEFLEAVRQAEARP
jgi:hypothetical protein